MRFSWHLPEEEQLTSTPSSFAGYRILGELGRGGMGVVYRAEDPHLNRQVAIKILTNAGSSVEARERFLREAELTARLDDPGIVRVHRAGVEGNDPYIVYELVEGAQTLDAVARTLDVRRRCALVSEVARALGVAHLQGIVHRDVKPENVVIDGRGRARLLDFGVAKGLELESLTRTGAMIGTPHYMAPEQIAGSGEILPATDIWALGVLLYWCLTGAQPFDGATLAELMASIHRSKPPPPSSIDPTTPRSLDAVTARALHLDPGERYADGASFAAALDEALDQPERRSPRARWVILAAAAATTILAAAMLTQGTPQNAGADQPDVAGNTLTAGGLQLTVNGPPDGVARMNPVVLTGTVEGTGAKVEVTCGRVTQTVALGPDGKGALRLEVRATEGKNRFTVRAIDAAQVESDPVTVEVLYEPWPRWYAKLSPELRAPFPLPKGIRFGEHPGDYVNRTDGSVLVWLPAGGLDSPTLGRAEFSEGVFIGREEVTWRQYRRFCEAAGHAMPVTADLSRAADGMVGDSDPVFAVDWSDAAAYCEWAELRLPSEAEWELAAALTAGGRHAKTHTIKALPQGVREWCADKEGEDRVIRGGSWMHVVGFTSNRNPRGPSLRDVDLGFRVARSGK